jgi:hypothetical protein
MQMVAVEVLEVVLAALVILVEQVLRLPIQIQI